MDSKKIKDVYALEPGKIYCIQMDLNDVNWEYLEAVVKGLKTFDIQIVVLDKNMQFVRIPEGCEMVKKKEE